jgi:hypothetical protein
MTRDLEGSGRVFAERWPDVDDQLRDSVQLADVI